MMTNKNNYIIKLFGNGEIIEVSSSLEIGDVIALSQSYDSSIAFMSLPEFSDRFGEKCYTINLYDYSHIIRGRIIGRAPRKSKLWEWINSCLRRF